MFRPLQDIKFFFQESKYDIKNNDLRLRQASQHGDVAEVKRLIKQTFLKRDDAQFGTNPITGKPYSGNTALHQAALGKHAEILKVLVRAGWSPTAKNTQGKTVFDLINDAALKKELLGLHNLKEMSEPLEDIYKALKPIEKLNLEEHVYVLSLACGMAIEAPVLHELYPQKTIHYVGVDNDKVVCDFSIEYCKELSNTSFHCIDATDILKLKKLLNDQKFDLIILRHPDIFGRKNIFKTMIEKTIPQFIQPHGISILSTYNEKELYECANYFGQNLIPMKNSKVDLHGRKPFPVNGVNLIFDAHTLLLECTPELKKTLASEESVSSEITGRPFF